MVSVGGETRIGFERSREIDTGQVHMSIEHHSRRGTGGQRAAVVLGDWRVVIQLVEDREVRNCLGTEILKRYRHGLVVREIAGLRNRGGDGHHTHIVLRHRGVDGNRGFGRLASAIHLELRIDTIAGEGEATR